MLPSEQYQIKIDQGELRFHPQQWAVMQYFDQLFEALTQTESWWEQLNPFKKSELQGFYLWGSVGVGKTMMMDLFYNHLTMTEKLRTHLHSFLLDIHAALKKQQGQMAPLKKIAHELRQKYRIIFFDEFYVKDVADAMIFTELFQALFSEGIILIASSNVAPEQLYEKGLQRERFLPTINLIKTHCKIIPLNLNIDYRRSQSIINNGYFLDTAKNAHEKMKNIFSMFNQECHVIEKQEAIVVNHRKLHFQYKTVTSIWFEFEDLCGVPRAVQDYLVLAEQLTFFFIEHVPIFSQKNIDLALNFIKLIDVLYEKQKIVIISAEAEPDQLYTEGLLKTEFARCQSRLIEMRSAAYIKRIIH